MQEDNFDKGNMLISYLFSNNTHVGNTIIMEESKKWKLD